MSWLTDPAQAILGSALDGLARREALIGSNLANIDTPGFRPQSVDFEAALREQFAASPLANLLDQAGQGTASGSTASALGAATVGGLHGPAVGPSAAIGMRATDPRHLQGTAGSMSLAPDPSTFDASLRNDENTVDVDSEMTALAETQLKYSAVSKLLSGKLGMLRDAAGGH